MCTRHSTLLGRADRNNMRALQRGWGTLDEKAGGVLEVQLMRVFDGPRWSDAGSVLTISGGGRAVLGGVAI